MNQITIDGVNYVCEVAKVAIQQDDFWTDLIVAGIALFFVIIIIVAIIRSNKKEREFFEKFARGIYK